MNWNELSDDEKARLNKRTPIDKDDPTAFCTAAGQANMQKLHEVPKPPAVPNGRIFHVTAAVIEYSKDRLERPVHTTRHVSFTLECERYIDARAAATALAGGTDVKVSSALEPLTKPLPRWQVRWKGSAMQPDNPLYLQVRLLEEGKESGWTPLRDAKVKL